MSTMRDAALAYAAKGWPVFPLVARGKRPLTPHGLNEATTNPNVIERWWDRWPDANVGLATGEELGAWVLDVDGAKGGASLTQLEAELGPLPETREQQTGGGGMHRFFAWPAGREIRNKQALRPGIDVRGNGGYVVAPPSIHASGQPYAWLGEGPFTPAPPEWLDLIAPVRPVAPWERVDPPKPRTPSLDVVRTPIVDRARLYLREVDPAVSGQGGHNKLLWAARALVIGFELDDATAISLLWSDYNPRCVPPWNPDDERERREFERKVAQARSTPSEKRPGWLLDELGLRSGMARLREIAAGAEIAARLLANATPPEIDPADVEPPAPPEPPGTRQEFPIGLFPAAIRDFCLMVAESHDVDLSFAALPALVVAGSAMGNAWRLALKESWLVPPTLWGVLIAYPGSNKTAPLAEVVEPLYELVRADTIPNLLLNPQGGRTIVQNTTVEALAVLMSQSPRGLLCFNDELSGWSESFDRGKQTKKRGSADEAAWLSFWNAQRYMVDRKTDNEQVSIPAAACSVLGGIQPQVFAECFDARRFASGLVPRLLIACPPRRRRRWREEVVTVDGREVWRDVIRWLRCTPFRSLCPNSGQYKPRVANLSPEAQVRFKAFCETLWSEMEGITNENDLALFSKTDTQAGRLALVHHGLRLACGGRELDAPVALESVDAGIAWARWFLAEQRITYGYSQAVFRQQNVAELAERLAQAFPGGSVTVREVQRILKLSRAEHARSAVAGLVEFGFATWADPKKNRLTLVKQEKAA